MSTQAPCDSDRRASAFPAVTYALIVVNVGIYVWLWLSPLERQAVLDAVGLIPAHASVSSILTSMFSHAGASHLIWNMLFLWLFGPSVERAMGRLEYSILYFGSGFAAALLHVAVVHKFMPAAANIPMLGASGAIAGILGVSAVRFFNTRIRVFCGLRCYGIPAMAVLGIWFLNQIVQGLRCLGSSASGGLAYWSHIGGMIFGILLAWVLRLGREGFKEFLMVDAQVSLEHGTPSDAVERLRMLIERDPENADAHRELAKIYAMQKDEPRSIAHYRQCIDCHLRMGERDKAVACFDELSRSYRNVRLDLRTEYQLARHLMETGNDVSALRLFENIADTYPGTPEAELALMKAGDLYLDSFDDPGNAARCYERFLQEYPYSTWRSMVDKSLAETRKSGGRDK